MARKYADREKRYWWRIDDGKPSKFLWTNLGGQRVSTGCTSLDAARAWKAEREREAVDPTYAASRSTPIKSAIAEFIDELRVARRSAKTIAYYEQKLGTWLTFLADRDPNHPDPPIATITPALVTKFVAWRTTPVTQADGTEVVAASPQTARKEVAALITMLRSAKHRGAYPGDVMALKPLRMAGQYEPRKRHPTREQFAALVVELERRNLRHRAALLCAAVATGGRLGELHRLRRQDVNAETGWFQLYVTKTRKTEGEWRDRFAVPEARPLLQYALDHGGGKDGLVLRPWAPANMVQTLARVGDKISVPSFSANDFRRAMASWLRQDGVPPNLVAFMLGHTSSAMVERVYGRMTASAAADLIERARRTVSVPNTAETGRLPPKTDTERT